MVVDGLVWHTSRVFIVTNIVAKAFCEETGTKPFPIDVVLRKFKKDFIQAW